MTEAAAIPPDMNAVSVVAVVFSVWWMGQTMIFIHELELLTGNVSILSKNPFDPNLMCFV